MVLQLYMTQLIWIPIHKIEPHGLNIFLVQIINSLGSIFVIAPDALPHSSGFDSNKYAARNFQCKLLEIYIPLTLTVIQLVKHATWPNFFLFPIPALFLPYPFRFTVLSHLTMSYIICYCLKWTNKVTRYGLTPWSSCW
jgi:hypothetical protein